MCAAMGLATGTANPRKGPVPMRSEDPNFLK
eukprot:SAG22_NODE_17673_length_300_cov_1.278607_1_plen_30_part_10